MEQLIGCRNKTEQRKVERFVHRFQFEGCIRLDRFPDLSGRRS
jgi:hypothetical protein